MITINKIPLNNLFRTKPPKLKSLIIDTSPIDHIQKSSIISLIRLEALLLFLSLFNDFTGK